MTIPTRNLPDLNRCQSEKNTTIIPWRSPVLKTVPKTFVFQTAANSQCSQVPVTRNCIDTRRPPIFGSSDEVVLLPYNKPVSDHPALNRLAERHKYHSIELNCQHRENCGHFPSLRLFCAIHVIVRPLAIVSIVRASCTLLVFQRISYQTFDYSLILWLP